MQHKIQGKDIVFTLEQSNNFVRLMAHYKGDPSLKWCLLMIGKDGQVTKISGVSRNLGLKLNKGQALDLEEV